MRVTFICKDHTASVEDNILFIVNERTDTMVMKVTKVAPEKNELVDRHFNSLEEFYSQETIPMIIDELQCKVESELLLDLLLYP